VYAEENGVLSLESSGVICGVDTHNGKGSPKVELEAAGENKMCKNGRGNNFLANVPADEENTVPTETFLVTGNYEFNMKFFKIVFNLLYKYCCWMCN